MYGSIFLIMLCLAMLVFAALLVLAYLLLKPGKTKPKAAQNPSLEESQKPPKRNWQIWILYFAIALLIANWTGWGAIFFLAVIWVLRLNPKPYSTAVPPPNDLDRDSIKGTYTWLLISPVLTIPTMVIAIELMGNSTNDLVLAALIPLIFHTPLLFRLNTKSIFIYRHTQLAILLVALRAGTAAIALNMDDPVGLFLLGNGSLWLFGTIWARNQAVRKECWLMERKGEKITFSKTIESDKHDAPVMDKDLAGMLDALNTDSIKAAKEKALHAFQTGTPTIKKRAVAVLTKLGEVEKF